MHVQEHKTVTEVTGGITVVTALADIPKLYLAIDNTRGKANLEWLMNAVSSTPYAEHRG